MTYHETAARGHASPLPNLCRAGALQPGFSSLTAPGASASGGLFGGAE